MSEAERNLPEEIFNDALELPSEERVRFLERACAGDPRLREEVESLLRIAEDDPSLLAFPEPAPSDGEPLPEKIGRYPVLDRCGEGGMGVVYRAEDPLLGRAVALKVLSVPGLLARLDSTAGRKARERLEREARLLAALNHPNLATIHALEYVGGSPVLVMEFVEGRTLQEILSSGEATAEERLRICRGIAQGIGAAHERDIVHRDLKPANVMVGPGGVIKVLDFGIAAVAELTLSMAGEGACFPANDRRPQAPGRIGPIGEGTARAGTRGYMSPEQQAGHPADLRSDLWAFGRIICDCFEGSVTRGPEGRPAVRFAGPSLPGRALPGRSLPGRARRRLERLAARCLEEDPTRRPATMAEAGREIDRAIDEVRRAPAMRRLALVAPAALLIPLALLGVRLREREHERPIRAIAAGRTVETHYKDGRARVFLPPDSVAQALDSAYVAATARSPIIVAVTEEQEETDDFLLFWDAHGKLLRCIPSTRDTPFDAVAEEGSELYWRKWYRSIHPPSKRHDTFDVTEGAHYYPSTLRRFAIASSEIEETYRLYHAGHVNSIVYAPSFDSTATWLWMTGRVRDGGLLREIAGGVEQNTHFLACFEDSARGTEYFPAFAPPSAAFLHNHPEGVRPAVPILYFVIRGFLSDGDSILWDRSPSMLIHEVVRAGPQDLEVLLMGAIRLDLHRPGTGRVEVQASTSGQAHPAIARRARALGVDAEEAVRRFLADSVIVLIASAPGLEVTGDFTDRRGAVPTQWNGALPGWTEDRPVSR